MFTPDELKMIVAALMMMEDSDNELGFPDEANEAGRLIERINAELSHCPMPSRRINPRGDWWS